MGTGMLVEASKGAPPDTYITLSGIDWVTFEGIANRTRGGRICYDNGELEIMSPSIYHEDFGDRLRALVDAFCEALDIEAMAAGSTTWKAPGAKKAIEADSAFYFDRAKLAAVADLMAAEEKNTASFPPPDLVIEIDLRHPSAERSAVYAAVGAVEVWEFNGETVRIRRLRPDGAYAEVNCSGWFPASAHEIQGALADKSQNITARRRAMRAFVDRLIGGAQADAS